MANFTDPGVDGRVTWVDVPDTRVHGDQSIDLRKFETWAKTKERLFKKKVLLRAVKAQYSKKIHWYHSGVTDGCSDFVFQINVGDVGTATLFCEEVLRRNADILIRFEVRTLPSIRKPVLETADNS